MVARFGLCASFHPLNDPEQSKRTEEAARWFGTPFLMLYQNTTPGLLTSEAERLGKVTVGTELGWGAAVQAEGVRYGRHGVLAAAIHHDQLLGEIEPIGYHKTGNQRKLEIVDRDCYSVASFAGHYEPFFDCGAQLKRGEIIGLLHDFNRIDIEPWPVVAGINGVLLAQAWNSAVLAGQHIAVVGREI
jgi:predicted deacylase